MQSPMVSQKAAWRKTQAPAGTGDYVENMNNMDAPTGCVCVVPTLTP